MSIRKKFEEREKKFIINQGCLSSESKGRQNSEQHCSFQTVFQIDKDRIVYSNAFRRLKYKTQVFLSPMGDHYRTRLTHTLEVAQMARNMARAMKLNEDLAEAIALGHDLGHTPFGHSGEAALQEIYSKKFSHNVQSLRVVDFLEKKGKGLNLTYEVRDGILKHSKGYGDIIPEDFVQIPNTIEGQIVRVADIMAYLNHDLDDAIRSGVINENQVPSECVKILGKSHSSRASSMIMNFVYSSKIDSENLVLEISNDVNNALKILRSFLYENVYRSCEVHAEFMKSKKIITELYLFFLDEKNRDILKNQLKILEIAECHTNGEPLKQVVCDFIASMTDRFAMDLYKKIFFPSPFV